MSNVGEPVVQCRRCGWQPRGGDVICESCSVLLAAPADVGAAAGRGRRMAAALIDAVLAVAPAIIGWFIWAGDIADDSALTDRQQTGLIVANVISFSVWAAATIAMAGRRQSPGKRLLKLRVVRIDGGETTTLQYLARQVGWWLLFSAGSWIAQIPDGEQRPFGALAMVLLLLLVADTGMLLAARSRQSVHDRIFRTIVVDAGPPRQVPRANVPDSEPAEETAEPEPMPAPAESVAEPDAPSSSSDAAAPPSEAEPAPAAEVPDPPGDVQEQLEELERLREYLTPAQYERRRRSILNEDAGGDA